MGEQLVYTPGPLDRAAFVQILYNLADQRELPDDLDYFLEFSDVNPGIWYKAPTYFSYWKVLAFGTEDETLHL